MKEGRVLVVDDDPMVRETLGQVLRDEGYAVELATDGESALDRVHASPPDTVLVDLMMPGMNGRQFLQALRDDPTYAALPVMLMTAVHGLEVNLATLGTTEVIYKPFNVDDLLNKVALAVYRSRAAREARESSDDRTASPMPLAALSTPARPTARARTSTPPPLTGDERGVVLVVEQDRARLQQLDLLLSANGYTVVSMTRSLVQLSRLARALRPRAILLDERTDGVHEFVRELRVDHELARIPVLVFGRFASRPRPPTPDAGAGLGAPGDGAQSADVTMLPGAGDDELLRFVDAQG